MQLLKLMRFIFLTSLLILLVSCSQKMLVDGSSDVLTNNAIEKSTKLESLYVLNYIFTYNRKDFDILNQSDPSLFTLHSSSARVRANRTIVIDFYPKNTSPESYASVTPEIKKIAEKTTLHDFCINQELQQYISQCTLVTNVPVPHVEFYILNPTFNPFDYEEELIEEGLVTYDVQGNPVYPPLFSYPEKAALFYTGIVSNPILIVSSYLTESNQVNGLPLRRDVIESLLKEIEVQNEYKALKVFENFVESIKYNSLVPQQ